MTISCTGSLLYSVHSKPQVDKNASTRFDPQQSTCSMCGTGSNFQDSVDTTLPRFGCCKHAPPVFWCLLRWHFCCIGLIHSVPKWLHITLPLTAWELGLLQQGSYHLVLSLACAYRDCPGMLSSVEQLLSLGLFPVVP